MMGFFLVVVVPLLLKQGLRSRGVHDNRESTNLYFAFGLFNSSAVSDAGTWETVNAPRCSKEPYSSGPPE